LPTGRKRKDQQERKNHAARSQTFPSKKGDLGEEGGQRWAYFPPPVKREGKETTLHRKKRVYLSPSLATGCDPREKGERKPPRRKGRNNARLPSFFPPPLSPPHRKLLERKKKGKGLREEGDVDPIFPLPFLSFPRHQGAWGKEGGKRGKKRIAEGKGRRPPRCSFPVLPWPQHQPVAGGGRGERDLDTSLLPAQPFPRAQRTRREKKKENRNRGKRGGWA